MEKGGPSGRPFLVPYRSRRGRSLLEGVCTNRAPRSRMLLEGGASPIVRDAVARCLRG